MQGGGGQGEEKGKWQQRMGRGILRGKRRKNQRDREGPNRETETHRETETKGD